METTTYTIPAEIQAMQAMTSDDTGRSNVGGVYLNYKMAVATDGRGMVLRDTSALENLPSNVIVKFTSAKQVKTGKCWIAEQFQAIGKRLIGISSGKNEAEIIDSTYPDVKRVIPLMDGEKAVSVTFDARLLATLVESMAFTREKSRKYSPVTLTFERDGLGPMIVTSAMTSAVGVMMPMREGVDQSVAIKRAAQFKA